MTSLNLEIYEEIESPVLVDGKDEFIKLDVVVPERTIIVYPDKRFHIYKACYLNRLRGKAAPKACVVKASLCAKRKKLVEKIIRKSRQTSKAKVIKLLAVFDWIDDNDRADSLSSKNDALATYHMFSESLYREARSSAVRGLARKRGALSALQDSMAFLLSLSSGLTEERLKRSAVRIERFGAYAHGQKRTAPETVMQSLWLLHQRHFEAISEFLLNGDQAPLIIPREDIGYPDYKQWTASLDSIRLEKAKKDNSVLAQFFDEHDDFILDKNTVKIRAKQLGQPRYYGEKHRFQRSKIIGGDELLTLNLIRKASTHFAHLLLLASGCNMEQFPYLDFSRKLTASPDAKREIAAKPRADFNDKPVQFSANFLPIWRVYLNIRQLAIEKYNPNFGDFGIPLPVEKEYRNKSKDVLFHANSTNIRIRSTDSIGFPEGIEIAVPSAARTFKTSNLLKLSGGDIGITSSMMGRSSSATRKHYAYKAFEDSAQELTSFFDVLTKNASIKANGYSASAPIHQEGAQIHTGSCDSNGQSPTKIRGVTEDAPEPRCGAPVSCFFCEHYGHHADIHDIKLILSAKVWLQKQTKAISRNVDEHVSKFLPYIERIDDIIEDFRKQSSEHNSVFEKALSDIEAGNYSPYWRNKIDAFLSAMEPHS